MKPFSQLKIAKNFGTKYVLHDIDDTITDNGKLLPEAYEALWKLHRAGFKVIPVTGRPAGWCDMIIRQWPVDAVVGENGAFVYYSEDNIIKTFLHPSVSDESAKQKLKEIENACLQEVEGCRLSKDQPFRMFDLAIDFNEDEPKLGFEVAYKIKDICENYGAFAKVSSIHVNIWFGEYDKLATVLLFFEKIYKEDNIKDKIIFFGDSPNDEPMFSYFTQSCAVKNILPFVAKMESLPQYITDDEGGIGFSKAVDHLLLEYV